MKEEKALPLGNAEGIPEGKLVAPGGMLGVAMETAGVAKVAAVLRDCDCNEKDGLNQRVYTQCGVPIRERELDQSAYYK